MSRDTYPVWTSDHLDFRALITYLSQHPSYPCSLHIRNHLLAPYTAKVAHPSLGENAAEDEDPWRTWHDYRRGASVAAIGAVPKCVLTTYNIKDNGSYSTGVNAETSLWALVTVAPNYAPGWVEPLAEDAGLDSMRFSMWLNTERPLATATGQAATSTVTHDASDEEVRLIRFICKQHIPACMSHLATVVPASLQHLPLDVSSSNDSAMAMITIFSVYHRWVEVMQRRLLGENDNYATAGDVKVVRVNACTTFVMTEERAHAMTAEVSERTKSSDWQVMRIYDADNLERLVLESNGIAFPAWYLRHRKHLSVLVLDGKPTSTAAAQVPPPISYPAERQVGAPAGWAYAHDECAIASLHVSSPYRRLQSGNDVSVGRLCVAHIAGQLIAAQKGALAKIGLKTGTISTPLFSTAESHKVAATGFHQKMGFVPSVPSTWGALAVRLPQVS